MSKLDDKIQRLWDRGICDPRVIAKKLGYSGNSLTAGIERVKEHLIQNKLLSATKNDTI